MKPDSTGMKWSLSIYAWRPPRWLWSVLPVAGMTFRLRIVIRRFSRSLENLPKAVNLADRVTILDNSSGNYTKSE